MEGIFAVYKFWEEAHGGLKSQKARFVFLCHVKYVYTCNLLKGNVLVTFCLVSTVKQTAAYQSIATTVVMKLTLLFFLQFLRKPSVYFQINSKLPHGGPRHFNSLFP